MNPVIEKKDLDTLYQYNRSLKRNLENNPDSKILEIFERIDFICPALLGYPTPKKTAGIPLFLQDRVKLSEYDTFTEEEERIKKILTLAQKGNYIFTYNRNCFWVYIRAPKKTNKKFMIPFDFKTKQFRYEYFKSADFEAILRRCKKCCETSTLRPLSKFLHVIKRSDVLTCSESEVENQVLDESVGYYGIVRSANLRNTYIFICKLEDIDHAINLTKIPIYYHSKKEMFKAKIKGIGEDRTILESDFDTVLNGIKGILFERYGSTFSPLIAH